MKNGYVHEHMAFSICHGNQAGDLRYSLMKKLFLFILLIVLLAALGGCGGDDDSHPRFVAQILSDQPTDGDIAFDPVNNSFTITQGPGTLFFGIDDLDQNFPEYRAFLDFPLDGSTGDEVVPASAFIVSATLEVYLNEVSFASVVPTLIDLVVYPISGLEVADFDSPPLLTREVNFFSSDVESFVSIDITGLMREAQRRGLPDLQLRFILDLAVNSGFVGIEDLPTVTLTAPLLKVKYE